MIGLDTNVLVRYLTRDDPAQFARVATQLEGAADRGERFVISSVVLCELVWVLESAYGFGRDDIAGALDQILATAQFEVEHPDEARQALADFRATRADYSDALVGRLHRTLGAEHTVMFDRLLKPLQTFRLI